MYKVEIADLERVCKAMEMADLAISRGRVTNSVRMELKNSVKLLKNFYLEIKPQYETT